MHIIRSCHLRGFIHSQLNAQSCSLPHLFLNRYPVIVCAQYLFLCWLLCCIISKIPFIFMMSRLSSSIDSLRTTFKQNVGCASSVCRSSRPDTRRKNAFGRVRPRVVFVGVLSCLVNSISSGNDSVIGQATIATVLKSRDVACGEKARLATSELLS